MDKYNVERSIISQRVYTFANPQTHTFSSQRQPDMNEEEKKFPTKKETYMEWNISMSPINRLNCESIYLATEP